MRWTLLLSLLLTGCAGTGPGVEPRDGLALAQAEANAWSPEAGLIEVMSGTLVDEGRRLVGPDTTATDKGPLDGTPEAWTYFFQAPRRGVEEPRYFGATVQGGRVTLKGDLAGIVLAPTVPLAPMTTWRMDAADVVSAVAGPGQPSTWSVFIAQSQYLERVFWTVQWWEGPGGDADSRIVDDSTGQVLTRAEYVALVDQSIARRQAGGDNA